MASYLAAFHPTLSPDHPITHPHRCPARPNPATGLLRLLPSRHRARPPAAVRLAVSASSTSAPPPSADRSEAASSLERCLSATVSGAGAAPPASPPPRAPPAMKGGRKQYGAFGAVTLEKAKLDLSQRRKKIMPELATGGGGGDIGKRIGHGGGDGGDDDGDDDDYFDDFDDGEEEEGGLFRRRIVVQELFNREFVEAVLQEWCKTMSNLPAGLRQACEMGLVSSAQMVCYLSIFARPTNTRSLSRALPGWLSRGLVGRTLADPSFPHKMALEFMATFSSSIWWEINIRKERFGQEWDLVIVNALTASCCNLMVIGLLAPCRSYGSTSRFDFQNAIEKLPNNIFEKSYPLREFDLPKRISAFFYKAAEFSLVGFVAGSVQGGMSKVLSARKERRLSVTIPSISANALGYGALLALYANLRYQLLCGLDQYMVKRFDVLGVAIFFSTAARLMNIQIGEASRRTWLGEEADPQYSDRLLRAYKRPVEVYMDQQDSRWFISKDAIVSGLGLLGIKQGGPEAALSKPRRKRVVRKKVASG
ncbi:protein RETICULATA-RELATED 1, chloroplastic-like [Miscanthus floridulus]|uniref:protein RETICULATA-RELATED 1, chloroplastic-like n=1 Tax=Miscanthus floridulus TaxID=154761 RepID=UPI003457C57E